MLKTQIRVTHPQCVNGLVSLLCTGSYKLTKNEKIPVLRDVMLCCFAGSFRHFEGTVISGKSGSNRPTIRRHIQQIAARTESLALSADSPMRQILLYTWRRNVFSIIIHGSVHRDSVLISSNKMQQYAGIYLLQVYSTCFGRPSRPPVTAASGTGHSNGATNFLQRGPWPRWRKIVAPLL